MTPERFNRRARAELRTLLREQVIDAAAYDRLLARYPVSRWDWASLGRWFGIFGAVSLAAGVVFLVREVLDFTLVELAWLLGVVMSASFAGGWRLRDARFVWTRRALELCGAFTLIGLTFTVGAIYASGSGNWPSSGSAASPVTTPAGAPTGSG
jgi:uncharacterized membrane protein